MTVTVEDMRRYDKSLTGYSDSELQDAIDAEAAAQGTALRLPDPIPANLTQALKRRVIRNLAMRKLPLATLQGDADGGGLILPGRDPEVRRLENPYRRLVIG